MTIDKWQVEDREFKKFRQDPNEADKSVVAVTLEQGVGEEVQIEGEFAPSGLRTDLKITNMTAGGTATALPTTPLTDRNSLIIFNQSTTDTLYFGKSDVAASGADEGWPIDPGSFFATDIKDTIVVYGITSGATVNVKIMEVS